MKKVILALGLLVASFSMNAQTEEELKADLAAKNAEIAKLQGEAGAIQAKIDAMPGWKIGAFGTIGGSISQFNDWYTNAAPNNNSGNIGITFNSFANLQQEKYFWRNGLNVNLGWVKLDNRDLEVRNKDFAATTDIFNVTSLYGYKLSEKLAVSSLLEYRTTIIENFNDPGYLDLGVGGTWTPIKDLVVVFHPLNYNFVFSSSDTVFESSLGCKFVADYTRNIGKINFKTNLTGFYSYEDIDYSNWQWTNSFSYTLWKALGVGFDFGLRGNKQEAYNYGIGLGNFTADSLSLEDFDDNKIQSFWNLGLSYAF